MEQPIWSALHGLVKYALDCGLLDPSDRIWATNQLLNVLQLDTLIPAKAMEAPLEELLRVLLDYAVQRGLIVNSITFRDLFDTKLMGCLTPSPKTVQTKFFELYQQDPVAATDWFYKFCGDCDYIRRYRIAKDMQWEAQSDYGTLEITINLSKPEKDPNAIAAARSNSSINYPACQLCVENEGYSGRVDHPARENLRIIPLRIHDQDWGMQYSPYVYYNEHCIVLNKTHTPMAIDGTVFRKLFDFVRQMPHYFIGSNADLPIVGGSILAHEHFQGGHHVFPMERANIEIPLQFSGFEEITAGIVHWPMSVLRLSGREPEQLSRLAEHILSTWREYSDPESNILAYTHGTPHNTITPIARRRGEEYELDLVLRNNLTTEEYPLGLYHPHPELHHIKRENIGLIEVMGLAVLPARLKEELHLVGEAMIGHGSLEDERISIHAEWARDILSRRNVNASNVTQVIEEEVGAVFAKVLEHAGVFARSEDGRNAFLRFISACNVSLKN